MLRTLLKHLAILAAAGALTASAQTGWQVTKTFPIGGDGSWDYVTVDSPSHRIFVTRTTHTMAIDSETGKVLGDITGQKTSHGVAIVPKANRGFITDGGGSGAIVIFDLKTYAVLGKLPAMADADGIIYDAATDHVLAVSGDGGALLTVKPDVDPAAGKLDPAIDLGGKPEFLAVDGHGKAFINLEDKDTVAEVDLNTRKVLARWPVAPGGHPVGLAIDATGHHLFIGCRNPQKLVVMNTQTGAVEADLPIGTGVDATAFGDGEAFASTGDGNLTVAAEKSGKWQVVDTVKTATGARTMGLDATTHRIYLPAADLQAASPGGGRPRPVPGSFKIIVVSK